MSWAHIPCKGCSEKTGMELNCWKSTTADLSSNIGKNYVYLNLNVQQSGEMLCTVKTMCLFSAAQHSTTTAEKSFLFILKFHLLVLFFRDIHRFRALLEKSNQGQTLHDAANPGETASNTHILKTHVTLFVSVCPVTEQPPTASDGSVRYSYSNSWSFSGKNCSIVFIISSKST